MYTSKNKNFLMWFFTFAFSCSYGITLEQQDKYIKDSIPTNYIYVKSGTLITNPEQIKVAESNISLTIIYEADSTKINIEGITTEDIIYIHSKHADKKNLKKPIAGKNKNNVRSETEKTHIPVKTYCRKEYPSDKKLFHYGGFKKVASVNSNKVTKTLYTFKHEVQFLNLKNNSLKHSYYLHNRLYNKESNNFSIRPPPSNIHKFYI